MRKSIWVIVAVLLVAIGAPVSHADSTTDYTLSFTLTTGGPIATSGGTVIFDNTTGLVSPFVVDWKGVAFDFSAMAISDLSLTGSWFGCTAPDAVTCAIIPATLSDFEIASEDLTVLVAVGSILWAIRGRGSRRPVADRGSGRRHGGGQIRFRACRATRRSG